MSPELYFTLPKDIPCNILSIHLPLKCSNFFLLLSFGLCHCENCRQVEKQFTAGLRQDLNPYVSGNAHFSTRPSNYDGQKFWFSKSLNFCFMLSLEWHPLLSNQQQVYFMIFTNAIYKMCCTKMALNKKRNQLLTLHVLVAVSQITTQGSWKVSKFTDRSRWSWASPLIPLVRYRTCP